MRPVPTIDELATGEATARELTLDVAREAVTGARIDQYGRPEDVFGIIAALWSIVLGTKVTPVQVAQCMIQLKVARTMSGTGHLKLDSWADIAGYAACGAEAAGIRTR